MAIKQLKFVKSNGKSALGIHEYIARLGENRDNADKCLVQGYEHLPEFARDNPLFFWQMTDEHERANAKACTHVVVALPRELDVEAQTRMVEDFVQRNFKGCPLSWAIHEGKDQHNPHAHLQICERRIETERESKFSEKRFFKRNGVKKDRALNERKFCSHLYRQYAGSINHHLQKAGSEARIKVEAKNQDFEAMGLSEKMQKNFDQEMAELEKRQAEEMAELLKNLTKESKEQEDLRIEDLMEFRKELLKEQELLEKEEEEHVWQREEYRRTESETDGSRETIKSNEGERRETGAESRSLLENAEREFTGKHSSSEAEYRDYKTTKGIASFIKFLLTGRDTQRDSENYQSDRGIKGRTEERAGVGKLSNFAQRVFQTIGDIWNALFKKKALKKVEDQTVNIQFDPERVPDFDNIKISSKQKRLSQSLLHKEKPITEEVSQEESRGIKF